VDPISQAAYGLMDLVVYIFQGSSVSFDGACDLPLMVRERSPRINEELVPREYVQNQPIKLGGSELLIRDLWMRFGIPPVVSGLPEGLGPYNELVGEGSVNRVEGIVVQGICHGSDASIRGPNIDSCRRPLIGDARVETPIPIRETPHLGRIGELRGETGIRSAVHLDDGWELSGKKLFVESNIRTVPGGKCHH